MRLGEFCHTCSEPCLPSSGVERHRNMKLFCRLFCKYSEGFLEDDSASGGASGERPTLNLPKKKKSAFLLKLLFF